VSKRNAYTASVFNGLRNFPWSRFNLYISDLKKEGRKLKLGITSFEHFHCHLFEFVLKLQNETKKILWLKWNYNQSKHVLNYQASEYFRPVHITFPIFNGISFHFLIFVLFTNKQTNKQTNKNKRTKKKQTNRQTNKQTNKQTGKQTDKQTDRQTNRQTNRQANKQTNKQTDRQINKQTNKNKQTKKTTDKQTNRQTDRQTNRQTHKQINRQTNRQTDKQTNKQTNRQINKAITYPAPTTYKSQEG